MVDREGPIADVAYGTTGIDNGIPIGRSTLFRTGSVGKTLTDLAVMVAVENGRLDSAYADFFATPRFQALLMSAFALLGLAIAAVGLYGVLAHAIAQRTREFGIRLALGARPGDVLWLVLRSGLTLTIAGVAASVAGSLVVTRALESLLVEIQPTDRLTYAIVVGSLVLVAGAACWIPARRAT